MKMSDRDILKCINIGTIKIEPFIQENLQPASIDLTLARDIKKIPIQSRKGVYNISETMPIPIFPNKKIKYEEDRWMNLYPNEFAIASTNEWIEISQGIGATVKGRSSVARSGLKVESAGWVDPGFKGNITLELYNETKNIWSLQEGMKICQILFEPLTSCSIKPYQGKYQKQKGVTEGRLYEDYKGLQDT
jgi:dCTP deaminase